MFVCYILFGCFLFLASPVRTGAESEVAFKCLSNSVGVCIISAMKFTDPSQALKLRDAESKTHLNIKAGTIEALTMKHCEILRSFDKLTIARTGLRELCIAKSFRTVSAENNQIRKLHVDEIGTDGDFRMEVLKLNGNQLDNVESMSQFVALKELHLERNALTTLNMASFARMKSLERLFLANNRLNRVASDGLIELPKLSFIGLENNTLTELKVHHWEMESLARLELASNNLTQVNGLAKLSGLDEVSLASNNWECSVLDSMLETLDDISVTIRDGDHDCEGIRNTSICCKVEDMPSESTLLDEMKKYTLLELRYNETSAKLDEQIEKYKNIFISALVNATAKPAEITQTASPASAEKDNKNGTENEGENTTLANDPSLPEEGAKPEDKACKPSADECICPKKELEEMVETVKKLQDNLAENNRTVTAVLANQPHWNHVAMLIRHEFRTAVKRGDHKVKEVNTKLAMLRDYIENRLNLLVRK